MSVNEDVKFLQDFDRRVDLRVESVLDVDFEEAETVAMRVKQRLEGLDGFLDSPLLTPILLFPLSLGLAAASATYVLVQLYFVSRSLSDLNFFYVFLGPAAFVGFLLADRFGSWVSTRTDVATRVLRGCEKLAVSKDYSPVEALEIIEADASARAVRDVLVARAQELRVFHLWHFRGAKRRTEAAQDQKEREDALSALHAARPS